MSHQSVDSQQHSYNNEGHDDGADNDAQSVVSNSRAIFSEASLHSYLGEGKEAPRQFSGQNLLPYQTYDILLYPIQDVVLFPGETLPIRLQSREFIRRLQAMLQVASEMNDFSSSTHNNQRRVISTHIGIVQIIHSLRTNRMQTATVGTTIELATTHNGTTLDDEEVIFKSKAKYRFKIVKIKSTRVVVEATVMILPDTPLFLSLAKFSGQDGIPHWIYEVNSSHRLARILYQKWKSSLDLEGKETVPLVKNWGPIHVTNEPTNPTVPSTNYKRFRNNGGKLESSLYHIDGKRAAELHAEIDPVGFSFYVASNLVLSGEVLQSILEADNVITRLKLILAILAEGETKRSIACVVCGQILAPKTELFNVPGADGIAGAYVNRHGIIHQTMTLRSLSSSAYVFLHGGPSTEDSWFPGFAWTIAYCLRCHNHLGWKFTIASENDPPTMSYDSEDSMGLGEQDNDDSTTEWETDDSSNSDDSEVQDIIPTPIVNSSIDTQTQRDDSLSNNSDQSFHTPLEEEPVLNNAMNILQEPPQVIEFWGLRRAAIKEQ